MMITSEILKALFSIPLTSIILTFIYMPSAWGQDEDNVSFMLQHKMNATWRSNLLPRSRFLELVVFKKMLAQGLHLTRHSGGHAKPTTLFADKQFRTLWWYKSVGTGVERFPISSLLLVGTASDLKSGSTRQEVVDMVTIDEDDYPTTLSLLFSGASKRAAAKSAADKAASKKKDKDDDEEAERMNNALAGFDEDDVSEKEEIFFTCSSLDLYHLVMDGFGMMLEHAEAAVHDEADSADGSPRLHPLLCPHAMLSWQQRLLLSFHQLYRPEHHPNHPRAILRNGQAVEVLFSPDYVVEFNGQLMRLPNPFFGPGMNCRGKVTAFDADTDFYTVGFRDGPFEHDEVPASDKANFPKGTVFEYVKRANMIIDLSANYGARAPVAILALSSLQLAGCVLVAMGLPELPWSSSQLNGAQMSSYATECVDLRLGVWRLWSYQFHAPSGIHLAWSLLVQLCLGISVNMVHGNVLVVVLLQVLATPLAALSVGILDAAAVSGGRTISGLSGGVFALVGLHTAHLVLNFQDSKHGLLRRELRLVLLLAICAVEFILNLALPDAALHNSWGLHAGGFLLGVFFSIAIIRGLKMTHFERTYLIPGAAWASAAYVIFAAGWYAGTFPPGDVFGNVAANPSCCRILYDCDLQLRDAKLLACVGPSATTSGGFELQAVANATAAVASQTCDAYRQYLGLQYAARNETF